jgi:hypothetical protein
MAHTPVKPEKIVATAAAALEQQLIVPAVFRREGIDQYRGAKDDTINVVVEGVLPYRSYGWRNNRSTEIQFDEYTERKVPVQFGGDIYSAVKLTDEQNEMDFDGWAKLATKQTEAIGRGLEYQATAAAEDAPFEVEVTLDEGNLRKSLIRLRTIFNKLRVPGQRTILVGSDFENELLVDEKLNLASNVGEAEAVSALREASLGRRFGFEFVSADELTANVGIAMVDSAFIFATGAPSVPQSVPFGATASYNGIALRWIRDYDSTRMQDRSILNTYKGFRYVDDPLVGRDGTDQAFISEDNHFVRAVKVTMGSQFAVNVSNTELETITGITDVTSVDIGTDTD